MLNQKYLSPEQEYMIKEANAFKALGNLAMRGARGAGTGAITGGMGNANRFQKGALQDFNQFNHKRNVSQKLTQRGYRNTINPNTTIERKYLGYTKPYEATNEVINNNRLR